VKINSTVSFQGYKTIKDNAGKRQLLFNFPHDVKNETCRVEIFTPDGKQLDIPDEKSIIKRGGTAVDLMNHTGDLYYRYKITYDNGNSIYRNDPGLTRDGLNPAVVSTPAKAGAATLLIPDAYKSNNAIQYANFATKSGGTLKDIEKDLDAGKFNQYSRIFATPIFTDDKLTHHGYWNKNIMQTQYNVDDYTSLQKKLFAKGINWVADGAFVNEGLEGIHFRHVLKHGENSPYADWFNISNYPLSLGVFGKNHDFIKNRIVNSHGNIYIQIYDKRLVSKLPPANELIKAYDKNPDSPLDINSHNDTVVPYAFKLSPEELAYNKKMLAEYNEALEQKGKQPIADDSYEAARILAKGKYWSTDEKFESGFETWDANPDIAKLNYDNPDVRDYVVESGRYWTKKTNRILNLHAAQNLVNVNNLEKAKYAILGKTTPAIFPQTLNDQILKSIFDGTYEFKKLSDASYENQVLAGLKEIPPASIEIGDEISGVLDFPGMKDRLCEGDMLKFALETIDELDSDMPEAQKIKNGDKLTEYGKYVIAHLSAEIAKFAVIKALRPDAKLTEKIDERIISYNYDDLKQTTLSDVKIFGSNPKLEADELLRKINKGVRKISVADKILLKDALHNLIQGTTEYSFKLAEVIVERAGAGLDWRIDAAKDIADMESLRNGYQDEDYTYDYIIDFWAKFTKAVKEENPNSYLAAEITDINNPGFIPKFLEKTGITAVADYRYFFNGITRIFGQEFESGATNDNPVRAIRDMMGEISYNNPLSAMLQAYTFIGNHDKPRALHCLAMDMGLFNADLTDRKNRQYREDALRVITGKLYEPLDVDAYPLERFSAKAAAMGQSLISGFGKYIDSAAKDHVIRINDKDKIFELMVKSVSDLTKGRCCGTDFAPEAFGVKPFDVTIQLVIDQMKYRMNHSTKKIDIKLPENMADEVFEIILKPATQKLKGIMSYLVALPGNPTLFAGDDLAMTGYESKTKNQFMKNRNALRHEWTETKPFIKQLQEDLREIMQKRSDFKALNDGAPFVLPMQKSNEGPELSALLRQSPNGDVAICLFNTTGINHKFNEEYYPHNLTLHEINLGSDIRLPESAVFFVNKELHPYKVEKRGGNYFLKSRDNRLIEIREPVSILYHKKAK
jgi:glycosidase